MCGRFTLTLSIAGLQRYFNASAALALSPRYNIAPSQGVLVVRQQENKSRECVLLRWGLIPPWLKEENINAQWINARAETVDQKPLFRQAFQQRRCLIPASGFYEWKKTGKGKQPYYICKKDQSPLAFAGLWEHWENLQGKVIESCTVLTTDANPLLQPIHNRMPVVLEPDAFENWLTPDFQDTQALKALLHPDQAENLAVYPVSAKVNNPRHDDEECILPLKNNS